MLTLAVSVAAFTPLGEGAINQKTQLTACPNGSNPALARVCSPFGLLRSSHQMGDLNMFQKLFTNKHIAVVCTLPGTPITALASAFNYRF
jgi:hypothetical protein